ncbi:NTP transferase domain-containing protein [Pseudomonas sp. P66]|uniref:NTP transferase domain-containing protein n=1 Tax=Pseudomonas arcuscaelestis TaxID=2710591 RepID=A0ABS2C6P2_9PSED|nr:NTP transferase domain-containing protein [Pseudomonas arcuscaelestis]MBM5461551.1 NTP transferase domain-containing protein [Pseudomonas arcuscaelestis]
MQIIIPMSGFGERFRRAGYSVPKPLIEIDGKPIIGHVINMFPGEHDFLFICNEDHLSHPEYRMEEILRRYCPTGRIVAIPSHKLGPINAVRQVEHLIDPARPVIVNYCDFTCFWDWSHFKQFVKESHCAGAIPAYKGFHPHCLGSTNYAYIREVDGWASDIQEKQPYTNNRMDEFASSGTYYFASGRLMSESFRHAMEEDLNVGGEYYVSLAYKLLFNQSLPVAVYPLQHFMQWGTPDDVVEYLGWSKAFRQMTDAPLATAPRGTLIIPMAGLGQRFVNEGYSLTKPLIPVSGKPMVIQATNDLPKADHHVFVLRQDMQGFEDICSTLKSTYPGVIIKSIPGVTEGQACTALIGLDALAAAVSNDPGPVTIGACDNGALYEMPDLQVLMDDPGVDVIVWGVRGHANAVRHAEMFGWIDSEQGRIKRISVKTPLGQPAYDPVVLGSFTFRNAENFRRAVDRLVAADDRINGEFYIDSCINHAVDLGLKCVLFEVDSFLSWGTPNDLRTFEYWQSCFHKWAGHPYRLENDPRIPGNCVTALEERYRATVPAATVQHL